MAENKRVSLGNRVATPRVGNPQKEPSVSTTDAIARSIGARIRLTTTAPLSTTIESHIYACSQTLNLLTLTPVWPPPSSSTPALTLLPLSSIASFTLLSLSTSSKTSTSSPSAAISPLQSEDPSFLAHTARTTIAQLQKAEARIGRGVSAEAQDIYDGISRTLACRWEGKTIVVLEAVAIHPPYRAEDCRAPSGKGGGSGGGVGYQMIGRVRKVLENERRKIAEKNAAAGVESENQGPGAESGAVEAGKGEPRKGG